MILNFIKHYKSALSTMGRKIELTTRPWKFTSTIQLCNFNVYVSTSNHFSTSNLYCQTSHNHDTSLDHQTIHNPVSSYLDIHTTHYLGPLTALCASTRSLFIRSTERTTTNIPAYRSRAPVTSTPTGSITTSPSTLSTSPRISGPTTSNNVNKRSRSQDRSDLDLLYDGFQVSLRLGNLI